MARREFVVALLETVDLTGAIDLGRFSESTVDAAFVGDLVASLDDQALLTTKGREYLRIEADRKSAARARTNARARGRNATLRSLGMRRTAGGWE